jgi:hypothetical protein
MTSTTAAAINASDFHATHGRKRDGNRRDTWSPGAMRHLVKALDGAPVVIVCEKATGFTEANVTLGGVRESGYGSYQVLVQRDHSDGTTSACWYPLDKIGVVITLGDSAPRWKAIDAYREEHTRAVRRLQDDLVARLGVASRYDLPRGTWDASLLGHSVHASFAPADHQGPLNYTWRSYPSDSLADA